MEIGAGILGLFVLLVAFGGFFVGIVMIVGGLRMMRLQSRSWAMTASIVALIPFGLVGVLGLAVGIWSLVVLNRRNVRMAFEAVGRDPSLAASTRHGQRRTSTSSVVLWVLAAVVMMCACPLGIVTMLFASYTSHSRSAIAPGPPPDWMDQSMTTPPLGAANELPPGKWRGWDWGPDGPEIYEPLARSLGMDDSGMEDVNDILQAAHRDYLKLEEQHREQQRTDEGHHVSIVRRFKLLGVEDRIWSQLDALLAADEHERIARLNLKFLPPYRYPETGQLAMPHDIQMRPSLLGFGGDPAWVEIWRVGDWYHWRVVPYIGEGDPDFSAMQRGSAANVLAAESGPELPYELRRFWTEPPAEKNAP